MKPKPATVIRQVIGDRELFALVAEKSIHLMLQIIVMDPGIRYLFQNNGAAISLLGGFPDVQKQRVGLDLGGQGNCAVMDLYTGRLFDGHPMVIIQDTYV